MNLVVGKSFYFDFEVAFMQWLQSALGEKGAMAVSHLSAFGEEMLLIGILGFIFWCYDKRYGTFIGINVMVGLVLNPLIKNVFWRRRPYFDHETIKCFRPVEKNADMYDIAAQGFSFPSGHSTNSVTAYSSIAVYKKNKVLNVVAFVIPLLVGFSRVAVGVHYPTDVVCGWISGLLIVLLIPLIFSKVDEKKHWVVYAAIFAISCVGLFYCKTSDYFTSLGLMGGFFVSLEFEKRFVKFENTRNPLFCITRIIGGFAIYFAVNTLLKLPFSKEFLDSGVFLAGVVRSIRYFFVSFAAIGLYPYVFRVEKILRR
ncbi:Membrane-associated phospholipid phosphatase [Butyrivibrio proteoclasticus]|uniref:Membrane-associated phospholipid phosphatase n=1 Tax=Butyrivibrio proteoclasticus TaxID=43305 RepID=A0A1I5R5P4_9FIRM|nr:phosphatase PAP2 family protein [Butyrivibrio proteoclasticus]SFP53611.1 Membrane-associated phospholipid phosphatase [Butyrivibrio proteoclasticus]